MRHYREGNLVVTSPIYIGTEETVAQMTSCDPHEWAFQRVELFAGDPDWEAMLDELKAEGIPPPRHQFCNKCNACRIVTEEEEADGMSAT